ncbi:MAG: phytoene desaturase family protein [Promethearchaeota archaeon]
MNEPITENRTDFIIIGAGICGLSLGALLANEGYKILVLEKTNSIGGRAKVVEKDGFTLDYGIHTVRFGKKSALAKTLSEIKDKNQESVDFKELETSFYYLESKKTPHWEVLPTGLSGITKGKYFSINKLKNVLFKLMMVKKKKNLNVSVKEWQDKREFNAPSKIYLKLITASMQVCPDLSRASLGELRRNLQEVIKKRISVTYPIGGWKLIFERLTNKIINTGNKILTKKKVDQILIENQKAIGVKCDSEIFLTDNVIISVPVQEIFDFLNEETIPQDFAKLCKNLRPTAGLSLDLALKKKISNKTGLFYINNPVAFGFFTSNLDKGCAPEGKQLFTICSPCNYEDLENPELRNNILNTIKTKLFKAFPEMERNIEFERPLFTIFDGAEVNTQQYQELRPNFKVPGINNLYLVGDSTAGKGAGGDIGHNSVWETFNEIKEDFRIL